MAPMIVPMRHRCTDRLISMGRILVVLGGLCFVPCCSTYADGDPDRNTQFLAADRDVGPAPSRGVVRLGGRVFVGGRNDVASLCEFSVVVLKDEQRGAPVLVAARGLTDAVGDLFVPATVKRIASQPGTRICLIDRPNRSPTCAIGGFRTDAVNRGSDFNLRPIPLSFGATVLGADLRRARLYPHQPVRDDLARALDGVHLSHFPLFGPNEQLGLLSSIDDASAGVVISTSEGDCVVGPSTQWVHLNGCLPPFDGGVDVHLVRATLSAPSEVSLGCFYVVASLIRGTEASSSPDGQIWAVRRCTDQGVAEFELPPGLWRMTCGSLFSDGEVAIRDISLPGRGLEASPAYCCSIQLHDVRTEPRIDFGPESRAVWGVAALCRKAGDGSEASIMFRADVAPEVVPVLGTNRSRFWDARGRIWSGRALSSEGASGMAEVSFGLNQLPVRVERGGRSQMYVRFVPSFAEHTSTRILVRLNEMERSPSFRSGIYLDQSVRSDSDSVSLSSGGEYYALLYRRYWSEQEEGIEQMPEAIFSIRVGGGAGDCSIERLMPR